MITFHKIRFKNFLSYGNSFQEITLDSHSSTLIIGKNGTGKSSSVTDTLCFGLFGKPFRNIRKPQLLNSINKKDLVVEVYFSIGQLSYKIVRGIKPNIFEIYQNEVLLNQSASIKDYQEVLEKQILKMNYKTFCQIVILGSASFTAFMQLPAAQRREITEDVLDLQIFSLMNTILKEKVQSNVSDLKDIEHKISLLKQKKDLQEKHNKELVRNTDELILEYRTKIETYRIDIRTCQKTIEELLNKKQELLASIEGDPTTISKKLQKLRMMKTKIEDKVSVLVKELEFFSENNICPTCHQDIDQEFKHDHMEEIKNKNKESLDGLEKLDELLEVTQNTADLISKIYSDCNDLNQKVNLQKLSIVNLENQIKDTETSILLLTEKKNKITIEKNNDSVDKDLNTLILTKKKMLSDRELFGVALSILKDTGIKAKIIKQYIPIINKYINKYLNDMDFYVSFELNENFDESIKSRHQDEFSYSSFSEGEKARLNLAILFAWRAIAKLRNSASTNLLIFDEIMDGSLDNDGTDEFMKILNSASDSANIFIISHKTESMLDKFERVLKVEKIKNFSEVEQL